MPARRLRPHLVSARLEGSCGTDTGFVEDNRRVVEARGLAGEAHGTFENGLAAFVDQGFAFGAPHVVEGFVAGDDLAKAGGADALAATSGRPIETSSLGRTHECLADIGFEGNSVRLDGDLCHRPILA